MSDEDKTIDFQKMVDNVKAQEKMLKINEESVNELQEVLREKEVMINERRSQLEEQEKQLVIIIDKMLEMGYGILGEKDTVFLKTIRDIWSKE